MSVSISAQPSADLTSPKLQARVRKDSETDADIDMSASQTSSNTHDSKLKMESTSDVDALDKVFQLDEESVVCNICNKTFSTPFARMGHMRTHYSGLPRKFACTECDKRYLTQSQLKKHLRVHSGVKPYRCNLCPKAFLRKWDLTRHTRVHTGEKPFQCSYCNVKFGYMRTLRRHEKRSHPEEFAKSHQLAVTAGILAELDTYGNNPSNRNKNKASKSAVNNDNGSRSSSPPGHSNASGSVNNDRLNDDHDDGDDTDRTVTVDGDRAAAQTRRDADGDVQMNNANARTDSKTPTSPSSPAAPPARTHNMSGSKRKFTEMKPSMKTAFSPTSGLNAMAAAIASPQHSAKRQCVVPLAQSPLLVSKNLPMASLMNTASSMTSTALLSTMCAQLQGLQRTVEHQQQIITKQAKQIQEQRGVLDTLAATVGKVENGVSATHRLASDQFVCSSNHTNALSNLCLLMAKLSDQVSQIQAQQGGDAPANQL